MVGQTLDELVTPRPSGLDLDTSPDFTYVFRVYDLRFTSNRSPRGWYPDLRLQF